MDCWIIFVFGFVDIVVLTPSSSFSATQTNGRFLKDLDVILIDDPSLVVRKRDRNKDLEWIQRTIDMVSDVGPNNRIAVLTAGQAIGFDTFSLPRDKQQYYKAVSEHHSTVGQLSFGLTKIEIGNVFSLATKIAEEKTRPDAMKLAFLVLDYSVHALNNDVAAEKIVTDTLKRKGYVVLCIGVGKLIDRRLQLMASSPNLTYWISGLDRLPNVADKIPPMWELFDVPAITLQGPGLNPASGSAYVNLRGAQTPLALQPNGSAGYDVICSILGFNGTLEGKPAYLEENQTQACAPVTANGPCDAGDFFEKPLGCLNISETFEDCTQTEHITCQVPIRLHGLNISSAGLIEIHYNGYWGHIDQNGWNINNSHVVCRQLGFSQAVAEFINVRIPRDDVIEQFMAFRCQGNESSVCFCPHMPFTHLSHRAAGVVCLPENTTANVAKSMRIDVGSKVHMSPDLESLGARNATGWTDLMLNPIVEKDKEVRISADHSLEMNAAKISDAGIYMFHGSQNVGYFTVYIKALVFPHSGSLPMKQYIQYNTTALVQGCNAEGTPSPVVTWTKNGVPLDRYSVMVPVRPHSTQYQIPEVQKSDEGNYTCSVYQHMGYVDMVFKVSTQLVVYDLPSFRREPSDQVRRESEDAVFNCVATGIPKPHLEWSFANRINEKAVFLRETGESLIIRNISKKRHEGRYTCTAIWRLNGQKERRIVASAFLYVDVPPTILPLPKNVTYFEGSEAVLTCSAEGTPFPIVYWSKQAKSHGRHELANRSMNLHLFNISRDHQGHYTCTAYNRAGTVNATLYLHVAPVDQSAVVSRHASRTEWYIVVGPILAGITLGLVLLAVGWRSRRNQRKLEEVRMFHEEMKMIDESAPDEWEVLPCSLYLEYFLGLGSFGEVWAATAQNIRGYKGPQKVAVKRLKCNSAESETKALESEISLGKSLGDSRHPNIVNFLGCVTTRGSLMLIMEYVPYGDLLGYLRLSRGLEDKYYACAEKRRVEITNYDMISFARQIAAGMCFLASRKILHRDLAARNVLVGTNNTCKITDFGLAFTKSMYKYGNTARKGRLPIKWSAPELLFSDSKYSVSYKCDVWSYGIVLYEIFTLGGVPYPSWGEYKVIYELQANRYRIPRPEHVSHDLYQIMTECWREDPEDRPTFDQLHDTMLKILEEQHYLDLDMTKYISDMYTHVDSNAESEEDWDETPAFQPAISTTEGPRKEGKHKDNSGKTVSDINKKSVTFKIFDSPKRLSKQRLLPDKPHRNGSTFCETIC
ncbi:fibroblast growth factor receptor 3 [Nematostella vectensis]|uniref:fibroblast growth factor receptor 3 n=1 Tax=Nematostella vectensis TaxID=45351 RepID=UPI00207763BD|nr:fibroblast growth factor receptor 3 [Nematostella vectensis]